METKGKKIYYKGYHQEDIVAFPKQARKYADSIQEKRSHYATFHYEILAQKKIVIMKV